jgi:hypothetical protein
MNDTVKKRRRAPELPEEWQHFILSVLYLTLLPLIPLALELWLKGKLSETSLTLVTAIFSVTIGASSNNRVLFGVGILLAIVFSSAFGVVLNTAQPPNGTREACFVVLLLLSVFHIFERWNRHVVDGEKFWSFK